MDFPVIVGIVLALTQAFKTFGFNDRLTPLFAILAGIGVSFMGTYGGVWEQVLWGIVAGLSACGFYDVAKKTVLGK